MQTNGNGHSDRIKPVTDAHRQQSIAVRSSILKTLSQAVQLKDLAFETALGLRDQWSEEQADRARAVSLLTRAWSESVEAIRIARGKPLPGSRRPPPEQPKQRPKAKRLIQLAEPGEADCGPVPVPQPQPVVVPTTPNNTSDTTPTQ